MSRSKISSKYGSFSDSGYLGVGEPYNDKDPLKSSRHSGLNMIACRKKTGKGNRAAFDTFKPLYEKETYKGVMTVEERRERREARKKGIIQPVLKPPSVMRSKTSGLGSYDGSIGGKYEHLPSSSEQEKKLKGDYELAPRGITTKPGKKGSYGMRGTTISEINNKFGVSNEYTYTQGDAYDAQRVLERKQRLKDKKKEQGNPFRPSAPGKKGGAGMRGTTLGGPKGTGICGEYKYVPEGPEKRVIESPPEKQWRPNKPNRGAINKPLKYTEDPAELKTAIEKEKRELEKELMAEKKPFVPMPIGTGAAKIGATRSVVRMNLVM